MKQVYLLCHVREIGRDADLKVIGVYGSRHKAERALERTRALPGFAEHPDGFSIDANEVDRDHWSEGFVPAPTKGGKPALPAKRQGAA